MSSYFSFDAKIGRLEFALTSLGLGFASTFLSAAVETTEYDPYTGTVVTAPVSLEASIFALIVFAGLVYLQVLTSCKRLNDVGRSRWMTLWTLVPIANFVLWLYLCFKPGIESGFEQRVLASQNPEIRTDTFEDKFRSDTTFGSEPKEDFSKVVEDIERLGEMHKKGLLTDEEFQTLKKKLLDK